MKSRKFVRIADEKDRRVVSHHVPVAFFGVELQCKSADIALRIGGTLSPATVEKRGEHIGLLAHFGKDIGLGVLGNIMGDGEGAMCPPAFGMDHTFGNPFPVLMGQLLEQLVVLHQKRAARDRRSVNFDCRQPELRPMWLISSIRS